MDKTFKNLDRQFPQLSQIVTANMELSVEGLSQEADRVKTRIDQVGQYRIWFTTQVKSYYGAQPYWFQYSWKWNYILALTHLNRVESKLNRLLLNQK